ncbi:phospholipase C, phosphocholine-specific, partial [Pseudomonas sp. SIMBA_064]
LTAAFDFRSSDASFPSLPDTSQYRSIADQQCTSQPAPTVPATPSPIVPQEPGVRPARALPYELHVNASIYGGNTLRIEFANR